ncbi:hypothetical protein RHSIM_Rhsim05G0226300 [Rhododendron simsii]|uniref:PPM-type phosphatase domain-containing protein n=1 Tax=Rhododendron simsii TaxID=118357 RepID=A0A834LME7_RHOSS|nr:hypothetical protein RHSIM_Rhsim05G0226300 [Rhododendron simsii]
MGACCSTGERPHGFFMAEEGQKGKENRAEKGSDHHHIQNAENSGVRVRFEGSSRFTSMFSQQGRKGINQDAMTVWENFNGEKDMHFCAVFDGHGPLGHRVAQQVRDMLPSKLCSIFKQYSKVNGINFKTEADEKNEENYENADCEDGHKNPFFSSWKNILIKSFEKVDEDLCDDVALDSYCSGSTTVAVLKQGDHLVIANLGDSRAVLCTRDDTNQLVSVQLTVDLKPNLPNEAERIKNCEGRVFAMDEEPEVFRIWMPEDDCPGLAMARAFGDFCLKDFGLISTPVVSYKKLTDKDEFVVLATDGIWDVLSNEDVITIVASARKRSIAARLLVDCAVRAWRHKYPNSKVDDCAAICLFLKNKPSLTKSMSETSRFSNNYPEFHVSRQSKNLNTDDGLETLLNCEIASRPRVDDSTKISRSMSHGLTPQKPAKDVK